MTEAVRRTLSLALALALVILATGGVAAQPDSTPAADGSPASSAAPTAAQGEPSAGLAPDIIVVMVDDFAYLEDERILRRLPNVTSLWLDGGVRFRQMYDETPLCCPARASFLTGQHTLRHGVTKNDPDLLDPETTFVVELDEAGYHTFISGKYLNRYDGSVVPPGWDRTFILDSFSQSTFWLDGQPVRFRDRFADDVTRQRAVRWLRRAPTDQPVFAWVSTWAPHVCQQSRGQCYEPDVMASDRGADECRRIPRFAPPTYTTETNPREIRPMPDWPRGWRLRRTCESLLVVDRAVRQLVEAQAARERPAWFLFMADHGMSWGQKGFSLKHTPPATRVPFYVAGPGLEPFASDALVSKIDVAPTIAEVSGIALEGADGVSLLPILRRETEAGRSELLEVMPSANARDYEGWAAVRTPETRYVRWDGGDEELYDLVADPWEQQDLAATDPEATAAMAARLDALLEASAGGG